MKKTVRFLVLVLAMLMTVSLFAACAGEEEENVPSTTIAPEVNTPETPVEGEDVIEFPQESNNGKEINILIRQEILDVPDAEAEGDSIAYALYESQLYAEQYLGVTIQYVPRPGNWASRKDYWDDIEDSVSNAKKYDIVTGTISCTYVGCMQKGLFRDLNTVESFDPEKDWWIKDMNGNYAINGKLYGAVGDISMSMYGNMHGIYFNTDLFEKRGLESPYDMVKKNTWTMENVFKIAKDAKESVDGEYDISKNIMGYMPYFITNRMLLVFLGIDLIDRDATTGTVTVKTAPSEKLISIFDTMFDAFENEDSMFVDTTNTCYDYFKNNTVLMTSGNLDTIRTTLRDMESDWGVVPLYKYEAEDEYLTAVAMDTTMWHLPANTLGADAELCAKIMELFGWYNKTNLVEAYYEDALGKTYARDPNARVMLGIMRENSILRWEYVYDIVFQPSICNILQMNDAFRHPAENKIGTYHGDNITTFWSTNAEKWQTQLDEFWDALS